LKQTKEKHVEIHQMSNTQNTPNEQHTKYTKWATHSL